MSSPRLLREISSIIPLRLARQVLQLPDFENLPVSTAGFDRTNLKNQRDENLISAGRSLLRLTPVGVATVAVGVVSAVVQSRNDEGPSPLGILRKEVAQGLLPLINYPLGAAVNGIQAVVDLVQAFCAQRLLNDLDNQ